MPQETNLNIAPYFDDFESDSFSDLIEQFETNSFSAEIRSKAISLAKHAFEAAKTNNRNNKS